MSEAADQALVLRDQLPLPRPYEPPRTATERLLSDIWREVLSMDRIGIDDAYHDLGGDSFYATVIVALIDERFQAAVPMGTLIETPTIREMASKIDDLKSP